MGKRKKAKRSPLTHEPANDRKKLICLKRHTGFKCGKIYEVIREFVWKGYLTLNEDGKETWILKWKTKSIDGTSYFAFWSSAPKKFRYRVLDSLDFIFEDEEVRISDLITQFLFEGGLQ